MILEHDNFFINCIPKTGSKSSTNWCKHNGMLPVNSVSLDKPIFATMRDNKDRILSGLTEDLHYVTIRKYNLTSLEKFVDVEHLFKTTVEEWLCNPVHPVSTEQCHYAPLRSYFGGNIDLNKVNWIHMKDLLVIDQLINNVLGQDQKLNPLLADAFNFETFRPSTSWYWDLLSKDSRVTDWLDSYVKTQFEPTYITL